MLRRLAISLLLAPLLSAPALSEGGPSSADYNLGSLKTDPPASLPGHTRGILWQDEKNGPLRFSVDGFVVPNVYLKDAKGNQRNARPQDVGPDKPSFALVELDVNQGKGMKGLNGMVISKIHRLDPALGSQVHSLEKNSDQVAAGYAAAIQKYLVHEPKGRNERQMQITYLQASKTVQVRLARVVTGRTHPVSPDHGGSRLRVWLVPYLTCRYQMQLDGKIVDRQVVPPSDPVATARRYNPNNSPW